MSFLKELQERKVFRVASVYVVAMWIIIQVASDLFPAFGISDWAMRLLYLVTILGFPVAIILGWAFELTPQGLRRDRGDHAGGPRRKGIDFVIVVAVAMLLLFLVFKPEIQSLIDQGVAPTAAVDADTDTQHPPAPAEPLVTHPQAIAVLAFQNMSSQADTEYFSDGMSEEILNVLANIPGLRVSSRTSAFAFKGKDAGIRDIARALQVSFVLEGSVRRAGDQVRITAQLIDARSDTHVWSETYDRELLQVFEIQDEIAGAIVERLKPVVLAARGGSAPAPEHAVTDDMSAYDLYLRGRAAFDPDDAGALDASVESLEQSLAMDADFARAHSALARTLMARSTLTGDAADKQKALAEAARALELDPRLREAHEVLQAGREP